MLALAFQLWLSLASPSDRAAGVKLYGNWQSCLEDDGSYAERIFYYKLNGKTLWAFHLGPYDQFALFKGATDDLEHDDSLNLLGTAFRYHDLPSRTGRNWTIPSLGLKVNVVTAMGSRDDCESFVVKVEKIK